MKLWAQLWLLCQPGNGAFIHLLRLQGTQANTLNARRRAGGFHCVAEVFADVLPVGGEVDAGQHDFLVAVPSKLMPVSYTHLDVYKRQG